MDFPFSILSPMKFLPTQNLYFTPEKASNGSAFAALAVLLTMFMASPVAAQPVGQRAAGMAGAFVGVADDAGT